MTEPSGAEDAKAALQAVKEMMSGQFEGPRAQALFAQYGPLIAAALESASADGDWVLVPREPSKEMSYAAGREFQSDKWTWYTIYRAVIGAAPKPGSSSDEPAPDCKKN
jgi:hypothetical protein